LYGSSRSQIRKQAFSPCVKVSRRNFLLVGTSISIGIYMSVNIISIRPQVTTANVRRNTPFAAQTFHYRSHKDYPFAKTKIEYIHSHGYVLGQSHPNMSHSINYDKSQEVLL
jgi:hypothetical protein